MSQSEPFAFDIVLDDGTPVHVRPVHPGDRQALREGFARLSTQSRFFRFLNPMKTLPEAFVDRFTAESDDRHFAIGAIDIGQSPPMPVAVARYERAGAHDTVAEMAVTVLDSHQGRGLGAVLIAALAHHAAHAGIEAFLAVVHPDNVRMTRLARDLGAHVVPDAAESRTFRIPLHRRGEDYPAGRAADTLRATYRVLGQGEGPDRP